MSNLIFILSKPVKGKDIKKDDVIVRIDKEDLIVISKKDESAVVKHEDGTHSAIVFQDCETLMVSNRNVN